MSDPSLKPLLDSSEEGDDVRSLLSAGREDAPDAGTLDLAEARFLAAIALPPAGPACRTA